MAIMPELLIKSSIIGRSPTGTAVVSFENEQQAAQWHSLKPDHRIKFFKQTITEEEVPINFEPVENKS